jgi:hypothetical protein
MSTNPIPEEHRRRALFAALYHHDAVAGRHGGDGDGAPITVGIRPEGHSVYEGDGGVSYDGTREYVKTVATALGYSFTTKGPFDVVLKPDRGHAMATIRSR